MKKLACLVVMFLFGVFVSGCATIIHGTTTRLSIDSQPQGATVQVGNQVATTPAEVVVKNNGNRTIQFTKEGYRSSIMYLDQQMSGWVWGNILFGGIIGIAIDVCTGGAYKLAPKNINATLEPK